MYDKINIMNYKYNKFEKFLRDLMNKMAGKIWNWLYSGIDDMTGWALLVEFNLLKR